MEGSIRLAETGELEDIMTMVSSCVDDMLSLGNDQWDKDYPGSIDVLNDIKKKHLHLLIENDLLGAIVTINEDQEPEYDDVNWSGTNYLVVHRLLVNPEIKGKGIGRGLMSFVEDMARKEQKDSIRLDTYSKNDAAINFYKKLGYGIVGEVHFERRPLPYPVFEKLL